MAKPSEADHPKWKRAMTYRQLLEALKTLSEDELDEAVAIEEPSTNKGSFLVPIRAFCPTPKPGSGVGPYLVREKMFEPQPTYVGQIQL
jgi:hypothetical protein